MGNLFRICNFLNNTAIKMAVYVLCVLVYLVKNSVFSLPTFKYIMQLNVLFI